MVSSVVVSSVVEPESVSELVPDGLGTMAVVRVVSAGAIVRRGARLVVVVVMAGGVMLVMRVVVLCKVVVGSTVVVGSGTTIEVVVVELVVSTGFGVHPGGGTAGHPDTTAAATAKRQAWYFMVTVGNKKIYNELVLAE